MGLRRQTRRLGFAGSLPHLWHLPLGPRVQPSLGPVTPNFRTGWESPPRGVWADMVGA